MFARTLVRAVDVDAEPELELELRARRTHVPIAKLASSIPCHALLRSSYNDRKGNEMDRTVYETDHRANVAKLVELADYAQELSDEAETPASRNYWLGMRDGLRRALNVVEGRG